MNFKTQDKIRACAAFLKSDVAQAVKEYLQEPLIMALDLVDILDDDWTTCALVASQYNETHDKPINRETVTQVFQALKQEFNLESSNLGWRKN